MENVEGKGKEKKRKKNYLNYYKSKCIFDLKLLKFWSSNTLENLIRVNATYSKRNFPNSQIQLLSPKLNAAKMVPYIWDLKDVQTHFLNTPNVQKQISPNYPYS